MAMPTFLVVDDNADSRFLLVKTLLRKFSSAVIHECVSAESTLEHCRRERPSAIVVHRAADLAGLALVPQLRRVQPDAPILFVSSIDRATAAIDAGASAFLLYDEWLRVGTLVADLMVGETDGSFGDSTADNSAG